MDRKPKASDVTDTLMDIGKSTARSFVRLVGIILASGVAGTVVGAGVCLWYGLPLGFALVGGVIGIVLALVVLYAALDAF